MVKDPLPQRKAAAAKNSEPTKAEIRARENRDCVGGLRRPVATVRRLPYLAEAGQRLRQAVERALQGKWGPGQGADVTELFGLKADTAEGIARFGVHKELLGQVREAVLEEFAEHASPVRLRPAHICMMPVRSGGARVEDV